jgi:hypothetical protein
MALVAKLVDALVRGRITSLEDRQTAWPYPGAQADVLLRRARRARGVAAGGDAGGAAFGRTASGARHEGQADASRAGAADIIKREVLARPSA